MQSPDKTMIGTRAPGEFRTAIVLLLALILVCAVFPDGLARADQSARGKIGWEWLTEKEGIKVWKRQVPGQELPAFRGKTVIPASIEAIMKVLTQNQHFPKWMYRCMESALLDRSDERSAVLYHRTDAPWPVWDRDVVLSTSYAFNSDRTQVELNFHETTSPAKPEVEGVVRMPRLTGSYRLHEYEAGKTSVIYQVDADIGGSIPRWLSTLAARDLPVRTLVGLRERVLGKSS